MDWAKVTERNRLALLEIILSLFTLARIVPGERPEHHPDAGTDPFMTTLPRYIWRKAMLILEPAEAALRRLIIVAAEAYQLSFAPRPGRSAPVIIVRKTSAKRQPVFKLFDPMKSFEDYWRSELDGTEPAKFPKDLPEPLRLAPVNAISLWRRINALHGAATNLKATVKRYATWKARRDFALANHLPLRPRRTSLMRPGFAPGWRKGQRDEVQDLLSDCHNLAMDILSPVRQRWG